MRAVTEFQVVLQLEPGSVEAYNNVGSSFLALGKLEEAIQAFQAAAALRPNSAELHRNLGFADARTQLENARAKQAALETAPADNKQ